MTARFYFSLALVALRASASLYWVDPACDDKIGAGMGTKMIEETIEIAGMIRQRLQRSKEEEPIAHDAFKELYGFELADSLNAGSGDRFKNIIGGFPVDPAPDYLGISEWIEALDQQDANVRIHCDNGEGFVEVDDPNAGTLAEPEFYAKDDQIKVKGSKPCSGGDEHMVAAVGYKGVGDGTHAEPRARVSICDHYTSMQGVRHLWQHMPENRKFPVIEDVSFLAWFQATGSIIMLHELTHSLPFATEDHKYGWEDSHGQFPDQAVGNADNYGLMGTLMMLMEDKYKMEEGDRSSPTIVYDEAIPGRVTARKLFKRLSSGRIFG